VISPSDGADEVEARINNVLSIPVARFAVGKSAALSERPRALIADVKLVEKSLTLELDLPWLRGCRRVGLPGKHAAVRGRDGAAQHFVLVEWSTGA